MKVTHTIGCYTPAGEPVYRFTVRNEKGTTMEFTNWGARWIGAKVPDRNGLLGNVLVGYDRLEEYLSDSYYMGAIVGRFANRIANAAFTIDGKSYELECNDGPNSNHSGSTGFHAKFWQWSVQENGVLFTLDSPSGEGGFPGNVHVEIRYGLNETDELTVTYSAQTDEATYLNFTNHAYFNLGADGEKVVDHLLQIHAEELLDTTSGFIPTGKRVKVKDTPFDFIQKRRIGDSLYVPNQQLAWNRGYNHCYLLKSEKNAELKLAATLEEPRSGRMMEVYTDLPSVLLYTAGYYKNPDTAVCLETQYYPDTPSHADFPSCLYRPGDCYKQQTRYRFRIQ